MTIVLQIIDLLYIKYETQESMVIQSVKVYIQLTMKTTREGMLEGMSNMTGRMWEAKYM